MRRFLERCHEGAVSLDTWIAGLAPALAPIVAPHEGTMVTAGSFGKTPAFAAAAGPGETILPSLARMHDDAPDGFLARAYRPFLVTSLTRQFGVRCMRELPFFCDVAAPLGFDDAIGLMARSGPLAVVVTIPLRTGHPRSDREPLLYQTRRHIDAGLSNLRRPGVSAGDVVAAPDGRVLHGGELLDADVRDLFGSAARAHDAERRGLPADGDAERVWHELWRGGWTLVESSDRDGKRMLLLRRNPVTAAGTALDARERRVLERIAGGAAYKVIASELGTSVSTASMVARKALAKVGFKNRVDFARRVRESRDDARVAAAPR
jgi:DNA-binding CsgD family transcriptional regulator